MKIRTGFVSNSSSSSFCILGINLEEAEIIEKFKNNKDEDESESEDCSAYDLLYEALTKDIGLNYQKGLEGYCGYVIGMSPYKMEEEETLTQFKARICACFKKINMDVAPEDLSWCVDGGSEY